MPYATSLTFFFLNALFTEYVDAGRCLLTTYNPDGQRKAE